MKGTISVAAVSTVLVLGAALGLLQLPGCGGGGGGGSTGTLKVFITDSPAFRDFSSVQIRVDKVMVVPKGKEGAADNDPGLLTVPLPAGSVDVDILKLHFLQQLLGSAQLPAGTYNQVRLVLAPNPPAAPFANYFILAGGGGQVALTTPSAQQTGVKINGKFTVTPGVLTTILLDFNPNTAIVKRGTTGMDNLKPTGITLNQVFSSLGNSASISGLVHSPVFNPHSSATFKPWSSAIVSVEPRNPTATAITSGVLFSNFSGLGAWKAPFTAYVPAPASYKVFVQAYRDTRQSTPAFQLFSSSQMDVTTVGQDYPVPPDPNGVIMLTP
jgi:hypothetical protein